MLPMDAVAEERPRSVPSASALPVPDSDFELQDNVVVMSLPKTLVSNLSDLPSVIRTLCEKHERLEKRMQAVLSQVPSGPTSPRVQSRETSRESQSAFLQTPRTADPPKFFSPSEYGLPLRDQSRGAGPRPCSALGMPKGLDEILNEDPELDADLGCDRVQSPRLDVAPAVQKALADSLVLADDVQLDFMGCDYNPDLAEDKKKVTHWSMEALSPQQYDVDDKLGHADPHAHAMEVYKKANEMRENAAQNARKAKQKRQTCIEEKYGNTRYRLLLAKMIHNPAFDSACAAMIIGNSLLIGITTEYLTTNDNETLWMVWVGHFCGLFFFGELLLRMSLHGSSFFTCSDKVWNCFDFVLVLFSVVDFVLEQVTSGSGSSVGSAMKTVKMLRIIRIFRVFRFFSELSVLALMITDSLKSLMWALVMLSLIIYVFSICFTTSATEFLRSEDADGSVAGVVRLRFGSLSRAVNSLVLSMLGGVSWGEISGPLENVGWIFTGLFFFYMFFTMFAVLNIITGVFVDNAVQTANNQREFLVEKEMELKENYLTEMREMFRSMDSDDSGTISQDELQMYFEDVRMRSYFQVLGIDPDDSGRLFRLLDEDGSGEVGIDEFLDGCLRLKGDARSIDVHSIIYESKAILMGMNNLSEHFGLPPVKGSQAAKALAAVRASRASLRQSEKARASAVQGVPARSSQISSTDAVPQTSRQSSSQPALAVGPPRDHPWGIKAVPGAGARFSMY